MTYFDITIESHICMFEKYMEIYFTSNNGFIKGTTIGLLNKDFECAFNKIKSNKQNFLEIKNK